jgi:heptose-I-phosphate ethanolaminephosphotransferase
VIEGSRHTLFAFELKTRRSTHLEAPLTVEPASSVGSDFQPSRSSAGRVTQWLAVILACLFLISPLLIHGFGNLRASPFDLLFAFNLATSLLWLALLHAWVRRPLLLHLWLSPLYLTVAIDLFLVAVFGARLSAGYVGIAMTDYGDTGELLATYTRPIALVGLVLAAAYLGCLYGMRSLRKPRHARWTVVAGALLVGVYGAAIARDLKEGLGGKSALLDVVGKELSSPVGVLFQASLALEMQAKSVTLRRQRAGYSFAAVKQPSAEKEIYVLVIGESSRPQNWSLFGYPRDTTPRLRKTPGLVPLPDMLTTAPHTAVAVPSMLSLEPIEHWGSILAEKSIVEAFHEAGVKTYWLSAQAADSWAGLIPQIAAEADRRRYFDSGYDGALLDELRSILAGMAEGAKIFVVLHTKGSHFEYSRRYPREFASLFRTEGATRRQRLVDEYDDSIAYTDWFLSSAIAELQRQQVRSVLLYASDHGENLLDDDRQLLGHALGTRYDLATAAVVWVSEALARARPDQIAALRANAASKLSLSDISHSMLDVAGIETRQLDRRRSIFSSRFTVVPRFYMVRGALRSESAATGPLDDAAKQTIPQ